MQGIEKVGVYPHYHISTLDTARCVSTRWWWWVGGGGGGGGNSGDCSEDVRSVQETVW